MINIITMVGSNSYCSKYCKNIINSIQSIKYILFENKKHNNVNDIFVLFSNFVFIY